MGHILDTLSWSNWLQSEKCSLSGRNVISNTWPPVLWCWAKRIFYCDSDKLYVHTPMKLLLRYLFLLRRRWWNKFSDTRTIGGFVLAGSQAYRISSSVISWCLVQICNRSLSSVFFEKLTRKALLQQKPNTISEDLSTLYHYKELTLHNRPLAECSLPFSLLIIGLQPRPATQILSKLFLLCSDCEVKYMHLENLPSLFWAWGLSSTVILCG